MRKSKSVNEVFFSSIGNMSTTIAALPAHPISTLTPPPSPPQFNEIAETTSSEENVSSSLSNDESFRSASDRGGSNSPGSSRSRENNSESDNSSKKANFILDNGSLSVSMETDSLNFEDPIKSESDSENTSMLISLGNSLEIEYEPFETEEQEIQNSASQTTSTSGKEDEETILSGRFSKDCSLSPSPPVAITSPADSQQEHFTEILKDSLLLFNDLEKWKLVHYSRVANWILERVKSDAQYSGESWSCVVGETGDFQFCISPDKIYKISFGHVTVIIFRTNP